MELIVVYSIIIHIRSYKLVVIDAKQNSLRLVGRKRYCEVGGAGYAELYIYAHTCLYSNNGHMHIMNRRPLVLLI